MNNLFSVFDPTANLGLAMNWVSVVMAVLVIPSFYWLSNNQFKMGFKYLLLTLHNEILSVFSPLMVPGATLVVMSLVVFLALNNFNGLFPYIFTASSHLSMTASLALPLWMGHMWYAWYKTPNNCLAHLVPTGTPTALMPFMVLIETVSTIIRPLTLSVRLAANMVAGHLLLTLLGNQGSNLSFGLLGLLVALMLLCVLEAAVAIIQAYVFSVLSSLYVAEVNSPHLS